MNSDEYLLFDYLGSNSTESDLPLLDNNILNEFNDQQFEIDNFLTSVPSNESECLPEFVSISQNCSFDSISVENSNSQSIDQYNSSTSSSTSSVYSPIQITPPETPPSCESIQSCQSQTNLNKCIESNRIKRISSKFKKSKNKTQSDTNNEISKKKRLLPIAPKTDPIVLVQLNASDQQQNFIQINQQEKPASRVLVNNLLNNNNSSTFNLNNNNQNVNMIKMPMNSLESIGNSNEEKLSKDEMSKIKEKARRLRNRQSAMLSRQKKQDYVKGIEKRLEELNDENQNLKKENYTLKDLVNKLTFENNQLKNLQTKVQNLASDCLNCPLERSTKQTNFLFNSNDATKTKKTISLLAVIFLIGLNMNLYNDNFKTYDSTKKLSSIKSANENNVFKGRVLLWTDNLESNNTMLNYFNSTTNCSKQNLISQNETLILESKLRNWALHHQTKQHLYSNFNSNKLDPTNNKLLPWYLGIRNNWNQIDENQKQLRKQLYYTNSELNYEQIINSVRPKDDRYYFLSLNPADHLILPLNFHSNTSKNGLFRPKFSLLLPAPNSQFSSNHTANNSRNSTKEFTNNSFLHLIEIDFEVINMKPIQILKNRIYLHNSANNDRFKRIVRSTFNDKAQVSSTNATLIKPLKSILSKNQTNVQSQLKKTITT